MTRIVAITPDLAELILHLKIYEQHEAYCQETDSPLPFDEWKQSLGDELPTLETLAKELNIKIRDK